MVTKKHDFIQLIFKNAGQSDWHNKIPTCQETNNGRSLMWLDSYIRA